MSFRCTDFANFSGSSVEIRLPVLIQQIAFAVALEDRAEDPAVAVEVGELRVLQAAC